MESSISRKNTFSGKIVNLILCALSLIEFLMFYIPELYKYSLPEWTLYLSLFLRVALGAVIPTLSAFFLFVLSGRAKPARKIIRALLLILPRLIYLLPYNYLYYAAVGYDFFESLLLCLVKCLFFVVLYSLEIYVYAFIAECFFKRCEKKLGRKCSFFEDGQAFDFDLPAHAALFAISFSRFTVDFIIELFYLVKYVIEYADSYRLGEIYFIIGKFLFILLSLFFTYLIQIFLKKKLGNGESPQKDT